MERKLRMIFAMAGILAVFLVGMLAIKSPVAHAQVAAPSLLPGSVRVVDPEGWIATISPYGENFATMTDGTLTPDNPAAMQWALTSEIALGQFDSENFHDDDPSLTDYNYDYSGNFYGVRWVGEYFSIGGEAIDWEGKSTSIGDFNIEHSNWSVSVNLFDRVSLGISESIQEQNLTFGVVDLFFGRKTQYTGVTVRLGEIFYLGLVQGKEELHLINSAASFDLTIERDVQQVGIALSTLGETKWHLEYQQASKEGILADTEYFAEEEETALVMEVLYGQLAAGITSRSVTTSRPVNSSIFSDEFTGETDYTRVSIGWVTSSGFALNAAFESTEIAGSNSTTSYTRTIDTTIISASYQF